MNYSLEEIEKAVSGSLLIGDFNDKINHISTDSRTISIVSNTLFVALKTERNDGHEYIAAAYKKGVRVFLVEEINSQFSEASFIQVDNTLNALQQLAAFHRSQFSYPVIGITGSNGKTIVKEWLSQLLAMDYHLVRSPKSYNSQLGVAISVLNMQEKHNLAIIEAGISEVNEMNKLAEIIQPTLGVLTNIGSSHLENFESKLELANQKMILFDKCDTLVAPYEFIDLIKNSNSKTLITWGKNIHADLNIIEQKSNSNATTISVRWQDEYGLIHLPFITQGMIANALTCVTVLLNLGKSFNEINFRLKNLSAIPMRMNIVDGKRGCTLINDSYSLDINSLEIALGSLKKHGTNNEKLVVVTDVAGAEDVGVYNEMNDYFVNHNIDKIYTIGDEINKFEHFSIPRTKFKSVDELVNNTSVLNSIKNTDVLIKGARKFQLEELVKVLQSKSSNTILEINMNAIVNNLNYFKTLLKPNVRVMVMVKALSYGAGTHEIAQLLAFNNIDYLGVALTDEAVKLRQAGISIPIIIMNPDWNQLIEFQLEPTLFSFQKLIEFNNLIENRPDIESYPVHIKIDTGMHRLGFKKDEIEELIETLKKCEKLDIKSVFTHLAASDSEIHDEYTQNQLKSFVAISDKLEKDLEISVVKHALNTGGILRHSDYQMDMVRLGIGLYGTSPVEEFQSKLETVGTLKTFISQINTIKKGESVGYNRAFIASQDSQIAIIPIGYADGLSRLLSNGVGKVSFNGKMAPIVGNICMDMTMIDVTGLEANAGDEIHIFGEEISIQSIAEKTNTISYEVLSSISDRVKRVFVEE